MSGGGIPLVYLLQDDYTDTVAAGSVNGTSATPTGGNRTVTDASSKISVGSGVLSSAGGASCNIAYSAQTRAAGKVVITQITSSSANGSQDSGFWGEDLRFAASGALQAVLNNALVFNVGTYTATPYQTAVRMRAAGVQLFIKGGLFTDYTLMYVSKLGTGNLTPRTASLGANVTFTSDTIRVPQDTVTVTPLASDAFTRADGVLGNTGGGGCEETGGDGLAWADNIGTWAIATNKATCSALSGGLGAATVDAGAANILAEAVITRSAGSMGMVLRYTDANNYIKVFYDGTNWQIDEIVGGTPNTILAATAATYNAAYRTVVMVSGTKIRLFYNDAVVGAEVTTAVTTGTKHGLFTTDTGATFDNFVIWARGTEGQYSALNPFLA